MIQDIENELLASELEFVSLRKLNHGFADALLIGLPDKRIFSFQVYQQITLNEEHGIVKACHVEKEFSSTVRIIHPIFQESRDVRRVFANIDFEKEVQVGFCLFSSRRLPVFLMPGNIVGSLCLFGLENIGRENGLEFDPSMYRLED